MLAPWKKSYNKPKQSIKKQKHHFADKGLYNQSYDFSSSHVWMWELDHKKGWVPRKLRFSTVVLKTLDIPLDSKEIKSVHPKGNQSWIIIGRTDVEAAILWPPDGKCQLSGRLWYWERLRVGGKGWGWGAGSRGWDCWIVSLTQWTWVWASSGR